MGHLHFRRRRFALRRPGAAIHELNILNPAGSSVGSRGLITRLVGRAAAGAAGRHWVHAFLVVKPGRANNDATPTLPQIQGSLKPMLMGLIEWYL